MWRWLRDLFRPAPELPGTGSRDSLEDRESKVVAEFCRHYRLTFRDPSLIRLALTHRSYLHVAGGARESNERLEFLGDSVLGLVTSEYLYSTRPDEHEGLLTKTKSLLVSKAILARSALAMGLGRFVLMSHSEVESGGRQRLSILADALEAVMGAIYLDQGFDAARAFIEQWLLRETRSIVADRRHANHKSHLQEYVQSTYRTHPVYRIRSEMGPDHSKQFMVEVIVGKRTLGEGRGHNKKEAEQAAARDALERVERGPISDRGLRQRSRHPAGPANEDAPRRPSGVTQSPPGSDAREVVSERRRRGRRGGRSRRPTQEIPGRPPEVPKTSAPAPGGFSWLGRPTGEEARLPEVEPLPPAREEDDYEEIGRPEGPREETRVDPFAWEADETAEEREPLEGRPAPPEAADPGIEAGEDRDLDGDQRGEEPVEHETPGPSSGSSRSYGRRPGRRRPLA